MQNNVNIIQNDFMDKLPPQAIELEEAVLGGLMLEKDAVIEIIDILKPESFYKDEHQKVFYAIIDMFSNNRAIDILTVTEQLRKNKELEAIGGPAFLTQLTGRIASATHIEFHSRIIQQKYIQRELIRVSTEIQNKAFGEIEDVQDLIDYAESQLFELTTGNIKKEPRHIADIGAEQLKILEELSNSTDEFIGIPSGQTALDRILNGFQKKKSIILAGRPGMGKTTEMISLSRNMAIEFNKKVAIFSLEMGADELWKKLIADITDIQYAKLNVKITNKWESIENAQSLLENSNIFIDDTANLTIFELRAKARRLKMKHDIDIVFIDYLQLMSGGNNTKGNREQEISIISRSLKIMAKELDIPIVTLSQLNRSVESRPDKKPQLSDLRESGAIEQDADVVAFIYNPEYYGFTEDEEQNSTKNRIDILIRKHRAGKNGDVVLKHKPGFTRIYDPDDDIQEIQPLDSSDLDKNLNF